MLFGIICIKYGLTVGVFYGSDVFVLIICYWVIPLLKLGDFFNEIFYAARTGVFPLMFLGADLKDVVAVLG
jgi:hypothetical protein